MAEKRSVNLLGLVAGIVVTVLGGYGFVLAQPAWQAGLLILAGAASIVASMWMPSPRTTVETAPEEVSEPAPAMPPAPERIQPPGEEALMLLGLLQEKGRFMDFLMDDVSAYSDAQVGAAARVVHQGCKAVVAEAFSPEPVSAGTEGKVLILDADYPRPAYRLSGTVAGEPPYNGILRHKGWQAKRVNLPRKVTTQEDTLLVIAPASVEVR